MKIILVMQTDVDCRKTVGLPIKTYPVPNTLHKDLLVNQTWKCLLKSKINKKTPLFLKTFEFMVILPMTKYFALRYWHRMLQSHNSKCMLTDFGFSRYIRPYIPCWGLDLPKAWYMKNKITSLNQEHAWLSLGSFSPGICLASPIMVSGQGLGELWLSVNPTLTTLRSCGHQSQGHCVLWCSWDTLCALCATLLD